MPAPRFTHSTCKAKREGSWDVKCRQHGVDGTDGQTDRQMCAWVTEPGPKPVSNPSSPWGFLILFKSGQVTSFLWVQFSFS